jgi:hypothetical protein
MALGSPGTSGSEGMRHDGLSGGEILSTCVYQGGVSNGVDYARVWFLLGWRPLLFNQEWWGLI